ncbi:MAG: HIT family hydrolase [Omnitrophica WOR_2 bacterium RIFOXYA2_FULL_45_12]|nr:MAG: HIT family hydrolase [Omnitrophica WOR_2 bacterium RIFOXYA2_FULL_45_12]OGX61350.1 MAG: HIT family hydrolase [Omnitrophica WOR_2 bacterium RIFOXYC2_FULL_45_15]HBU07704.1 HIT family hydrolase [Candidatus Omnitrophota bacterium]
MDRLWAPWRIGYINNSKRIKGCLFCVVSKEKTDKKNLVIFRSRHVFSILNKFPYNNGHLMVCPYRHIKDPGQLNADEILDLFAVLNKMRLLLKRALSPDGFNIGMNIGRVAGAGIPNHLHLHIVPRWKEDTNFMPALFSTKVISQSLEELYDNLRERIRE